MLEQIETIAALRERLTGPAAPQREGREGPAAPQREGREGPAAPKREARRRGLVPTMGALHQGHAELIRRARQECDTVVVSIFVNPLQFNHPDDLTRYPRTLEADIAMCAELGVDVVFTPQPAEVYPERPECTIDVGRLGDHLCGQFRPGHFRGVATMVLKLFQIVQPDCAYFGEKDAQQLAIIKRMVSDFNVPVAVVEVATVREEDGLALSSRNRHLTSEQRRAAGLLYQGLLAARRLMLLGERDAVAIRHAATETVAQSPALRLEYVDVVDIDTMQPVGWVTGPVRIAGAVWAGSTRLIDNLAWNGVTVTPST